EEREREERDHDAVGNVGRAGGEDGIDRGGYRDEPGEGGAPWDRLTRAHAQPRAQRRRDRPYAHRRGGVETAQAPLQGDRQQPAGKPTPRRTNPKLPHTASIWPLLAQRERTAITRRRSTRPGSPPGVSSFAAPSAA